MYGVGVADSDSDDEQAKGGGGGGGGGGSTESCNDYHQRLTTIYTSHNPRKVKDIEVIRCLFPLYLRPYMALCCCFAVHDPDMETGSPTSKRVHTSS